MGWLFIEPAKHKIMKQGKLKVDLNMLRSIAYSFQQTTHLPYDELFSEAMAAYAENIQNYDEAKASLNTFVFMIVKNHLTSFLRKERLRNFPHLEEFTYENDGGNKSSATECIDFAQEMSEPFHELYHLMKPAAKEAVNHIFENDCYNENNSIEARGQLKNELLVKGWTHDKVREAFRDIKYVLKHRQKNPESTKYKKNEKRRVRRVSTEDASV